MGWGLLAALTHASRNGRRPWKAIAPAVLLLSLGGPLSAGSTAGVKAALVLMHLVVGAILITGLPKWATHREHKDG